MQINFRLLSVATLTTIATLTACTKNSVSIKFPLQDNSNEVSTHSDDQNSVSDDMDGVTNDINVAVESSTSFSGGRVADMKNICNATATYDSVSNPRKITIVYNGSNCYGTHTRTGTVVLSMAAGVRWNAPGAALTVSFQNVKITRALDNKFIILNGSQTFTNVSGGLLVNLPTLQSITHTIASSNLSITFDDNTQRTWNVARQRVYTYNNGIVATITGTHTSGSNTNIAEWGTNRFGHSFTTSITQPLVIRQDCNFRLTAGQVKHEGFATVTATFGLDANGNPTSCPGTGHYYFRIDWNGIAGAQQLIFPY